MESKSLKTMFRKTENIKKLEGPTRIQVVDRTNRATDKACPLGGRKAVYPADTRMLYKGYVKQTVLTSIGSFDLDRPWSGAERCAATVLKSIA